MIKSRIITYLPNDQALSWGLDLLSINSPMCLLIHSSLKSIFNELEMNQNIEIFYIEHLEPVFFSDTLKMILHVKSNTTVPTENYIFISDVYLYKYLSFEFIYSNYLIQYIEKNEIFNVDYYHYLPHDAFFYTIHSSLVYKLLKELKGNEKNLHFHFTNNTQLTYKTEKFTNFNTEIAQFIDTRKIHLIGDHHVFNTFTPNQLIGCRSEVVFKYLNDEKEKTVLVSHFLGEITMVNFLKMHHDVLTLNEKLKVNERDICCFHLGELDVRSTFLRDGFSFDEALNLIPLLISKYIHKIKLFATNTNTLPIVLGLPSPFEDGIYHSDTYPFNGTIFQRLELTKAMNEHMLHLSLENNIHFFNPYLVYNSDNGFISQQYSDKTVYLNPELSEQNRAHLLSYIQSIINQ